MNEPPYMEDSEGRVRQGRAMSPEQVRLPRLADVDLSFIRIDHQARLQFGDVEVVIASPFILSTGTTERVLDPRERQELGTLLALYPDTLTTVAVAADCTLHLAFASGATIRVPADPQYEAWHVSGPGSALVVCQPAGSRIAFWS